jgi:hypothetical protein
MLGGGRLLRYLCGMHGQRVRMQRNALAAKRHTDDFADVCLDRAELMLRTNVCVCRQRAVCRVRELPRRVRQE